MNHPSLSTRLVDEWPADPRLEGQLPAELADPAVLAHLLDRDQSDAQPELLPPTAWHRRYVMPVTHHVGPGLVVVRRREVILSTNHNPLHNSNIIIKEMHTS